jgi:hypothetical protein
MEAARYEKGRKGANMDTSKIKGKKHKRRIKDYRHHRIEITSKKKLGTWQYKK